MLLVLLLFFTIVVFAVALANELMRLGIQAKLSIATSCGEVMLK